MNWDKYKSAFDIFKNITVKILRKNDYDDYENTYTLEEIGTVTGDMQSYSGSLAERDYGLSIECQKKFYCDSALISDARYGLILDSGAVLELTVPIGGGTVQEQIYVITDVQTFEIVYAAEYELGLAVLLKEVDLNGRCE